MTQAADERDLRAGALQAEWSAARRRGRQLERGGRAVAFALVVFFAALFLFPMYWMISTSLKPPGEIYASPPVWVPTQATLNGYINALGKSDMAAAAENSVVVATLFAVCNRDFVVVWTSGKINQPEFTQNEFKNAPALVAQLQARADPLSRPL